MTPHFKSGDFGGGFARGVDDIITVLSTDAAEWQQRPSLRLDNVQRSDPTNLILIAVLIVIGALSIVSSGFRWFLLNLALDILLNSGGSSSSGSSSSGGGFSGGGGSSGGGGASGSW